MVMQINKIFNVIKNPNFQYKRKAIQRIKNETILQKSELEIAI